MDTTNMPPTYNISYTCTLLKTALQRRLSAGGLKITAEQLAVLRFLHTQKDCVSMHVISDNLFRDNSTITRLADSLEKRNLIERVSSKSDRRVINVCLSKQGREIYSKASRLAEEHVQFAMRDISEHEIEHLSNVLSKIQMNLLEE